MVNWLTVTNVDIVVGIDVAVVGNIEAVVMLMCDVMMMVTNCWLMLMGIMPLLVIILYYVTPCNNS